MCIRDSYREKRIKGEVQLEQIRERKNAQRLELEKIVANLNRLKEYADAIKRGESIVKNGKTYQAEDIVESANALKTKFESTEKTAARLDELAKELRIIVEINRKQEQRLRELLEKTGDSIDLMDSRKIAVSYTHLTLPTI